MHQITCTAAARVQTPHQPGGASNASVRVDNRRTTILLEDYVWDCIDSMLLRGNVTLDAFCNMVETARLVVLANFRLLEQLNTPPFIDSEIVRKIRGGTLQSPPAIAAPALVLQLVFKRFLQEEAHAQ